MKLFRILYSGDPLHKYMRNTARNETQNKHMCNFFIGNYLCIPSTNFPFLFQTFEFAPFLLESGKHLTRLELFLHDIPP